MATPSHLIDTRVYSELVPLGLSPQRRLHLPPLLRPLPGMRAGPRPGGRFPAQEDAAAGLRRSHATLTAVRRDLAYDAEHYALYLSYQRYRHPGGGMDQDSREQYQHFLLHSNVATDLYEFRDEGGLRMVSLVDRLVDGLSSVYTFFEPERRGDELRDLQRAVADRGAARRWGCLTCTSGISSPRAGRWPTRRAFRPIEGVGRWRVAEVGE